MKSYLIAFIFVLITSFAWSWTPEEHIQASLDLQVPCLKKNQNGELNIPRTSAIDNEDIEFSIPTEKSQDIQVNLGFEQKRSTTTKRNSGVGSNNGTNVNLSYITGVTPYFFQERTTSSGSNLENVGVPTENYPKF